MTEKDKKEFRLVMYDVLEQIVLPRFDDQDKKIDEKFKKVDERFNEVEDRLNIVEDTTTRIELKLNSVVKRQDEQGDQILKINKVLKLEPTK